MMFRCQYFLVLCAIAVKANFQPLSETGFTSTENFHWSYHTPQRKELLPGSQSIFQSSPRILKTSTNLQAPSDDPYTPIGIPENLVGNLDATKDSSWRNHYQPVKPLQYRRNKRRRRRKRPYASSRQNVECGGTCRNAFSCVIFGLRADTTASKSACPGMFDVCCIKWDSPTSATLAAAPRFKRHRKKSGRALSGLFTPYYMSGKFQPLLASGHDDIETNSIPSSSGGGALFNSPAVTGDSDKFCGVSKHAQRKIMGGLDAGYGQFPWTAYIKIRGAGIDKVCSGTLIDKRWVLTAGHCTQYCLGYPECTREIDQSEISYKVILGEYDLLEDEEYLPDVYLVTDVLRHPSYQNVMRQRDNGVVESEPRFDIALMRLDRPVRPAPSVGRICLPSVSSASLIPPGTLATVVGWGRLGRKETDPHSNILQAVSVPVLGDAQCKYETGLPLYNDQLCAGGTYTQESACPGDSGGGLQVQDDHGRWILVGIVSNGPSTCGLQPVVFHKVENSLDWIQRSIQTYKKRHNSFIP